MINPQAEGIKAAPSIGPPPVFPAERGSVIIKTFQRNRGVAAVDYGLIITKRPESVKGNFGIP